MQQQLKEIILDYQEVKLFEGTPRSIVVTPVAKKASIYIGVRRCGKSTLMFQVIGRLLAKGVARKNILYLNFFDERLHKLHEVGLGAILEAYFSLYPEKKNTEKIYCFFDEIQIFSQWEPFVDRLMRMENAEVYITGSSAQMLSKEIATTMRGRALSWEIFPFSFQEFIQHNDIAIKSSYSTKERLLLQSAYEQYFVEGSFPEVFGLNKQVRIKILQEYFNSILARDLIERHNIGHPKVVYDLARWFIDNNAAMYSLNSVTGYLKSLHHKISKTTVSDYITWFEDAYFFFAVKLFDSSLTRVNANPKKIYCIDHAMVSAVNSGIMINSGRLLENVVYMSLRRLTPHIYYYKTASGRGVDFIMQHSQRERELIQVCESLADPKTKLREVQALQEAMAELKLKKGCIVTRIEEANIEVDSGTITVMPAWRFLLDLESKAKN